MPDKTKTLLTSREIAEKNNVRQNLIYLWRCTGADFPEPTNIAKKREGSNAPTLRFDAAEVDQWFKTYPPHLKDTEYLTVEEVAKLLDASIHTIRRYMTRRKDFPQPVAGGCRGRYPALFNKAEMEAFAKTYVKPEIPNFQRERAAQKKPVQFDASLAQSFIRGGRYNKRQEEDNAEI